MAELLTRSDLEEIEQDAVSEANTRYNSFIELMFLISTSGRTKREKFALIEKEYRRLIKWNDAFADRVLPRAYRKLSKDAYRKVKKQIKKLTQAQEAEVRNFADQLKEELRLTASVYKKKARKQALLEDLRRIREERLGYTDGRIRQATSARNKALRENLEFVDSKGRRIKSNVILRLIVGDIVWSVIQSGKASTWIITGHAFGIHKSVVDDRTTAICLFLDGKIRDLRKDTLPPLHRLCRSDIQVIVNI